MFKHGLLLGTCSQLYYIVTINSKLSCEFFFIYSLTFLVKVEICMASLPDFLCILWDGFLFIFPLFFFSLKPYILRYRVERHSRETTTTGVNTECASGISKTLFGLLERTSIVFHLESIQRVFAGKESCSCVVQLCRRRLQRHYPNKGGYGMWRESRMRKNSDHLFSCEGNKMPLHIVFD